MAIDYQVRSCSCSPNWGLAAYSCTLAASNPTRMSQTSPRTLTCPRLFADVWVVEEHEKDRAVAFVFLTDLPRLKGTKAIILQRSVWRQLVEDRYDDLTGSGFLKILQLLIQP